MSGWEGEFVSYAPTGAGEEDVRFQDIWYRGFQEKGEDGRFHMKMIRKADQEAKSWPRAGLPHYSLDLVSPHLLCTSSWLHSGQDETQTWAYLLDAFAQGCACDDAMCKIE